MAIKKNKKIIIALVSVAVIGLGYFLFQKKQQELLNATMKGMDLGQRYGQIVPQSACMSGLKMKYAACDNTACELSAHGFIAECLATAERDNFCQSVPSPKESQAARVWAANTCAQLSMSNTKCEAFIHKASSVCHEQNTGRKRSTGELLQEGFDKGFEKTR